MNKQEIIETIFLSAYWKMPLGLIIFSIQYVHHNKKAAMIQQRNQQYQLLEFANMDFSTSYNKLQNHVHVHL